MNILKLLLFRNSLFVTSQLRGESGAAQDGLWVERGLLDFAEAWGKRERSSAKDNQPVVLPGFAAWGMCGERSIGR